MTYQEFFNKYNGQPCEVTGGGDALNQCVDLANAYIREVLQQPIVEHCNAQDFPSRCPPSVYDYILNNPNDANQIPTQGDLMIFKSLDGIGHISIFDNGKTGSPNFVSFDENWPLKSVCKLVTHTYTGTYKVVGWLRCKIKPVINSDPVMTQEETNIWNFIKTNQITEGQLREGYAYVKDGTVANQIKQIADLNTSLNSLEDRIAQLEADAKANNDLILGWQGQVDTANKNISKLQADLKTMSDTANTWKNRYEAALKDQVGKYTPWQLIKMGINLLVSQKK